MRLTRQIVETGWWLVEAGLSDGMSGNVSARPADGGHAWITPSAVDYRVLDERDLVSVDLETGEATGPGKPSSEWQLHLAIYRGRADVQAVIHHHGTWSSAIAVARKTLPVLLDEAADIGRIPTARYAPSASLDLAEAVSAEFVNGSNAVLMANHGVVVVGSDLQEAARRAFEVERLARIYLGAELLGGAHALEEPDATTNRRFFAGYRAPVNEQREFLLPAVGGTTVPLGLKDLVDFGFRSAITFAWMAHAVVARRLHR